VPGDVPTVGIVGLGYVGLPLAVAFAQAGCPVVGIEIDEQRLAALQAGHSTVEDVSAELLGSVADRLTLSGDVAALRAADAIVLCVPTPLTINREPDLSALQSVAAAVAGVLRAGQLVVLESTTYPGTTREVLLPALEAGGLRAGADIHVAYSPERVDPGRTDFTLRTTPKVVGGITDACVQRAQELYALVCDEIVTVSSPEAAELTKLLENIFRSVNIALVNELAILCDRMAIDIREVVDAASTKPYGFMRFDPGPGMGGHCLPVDPFYLAWKAREYDLSVEFIELAGKVNQHMPYYCVERVERALNDVGRAVRGSRIVLIGVSYKANVGDLRESPALKIAGLLQGLGAELAYHDPHVAELPDLGLRNEQLPDALAGADLVVIVTDHASVDAHAVLAAAPIVLDLRGALNTVSAPNLLRIKPWSRRRRMSASTISPISAAKPTAGSHCSSRRARVGSPTSGVLCAARTSAGSTRTARSQSRPAWPKAVCTRSRTVWPMPLAST
jgi:UDP-N-acetyl-D-glucosamine dehydrogenase